MELLLTSTPVLDKWQVADAYMLRDSWVGAPLKKGQTMLTEVLEKEGIEPFSLSGPLMVPVSEQSLWLMELPLLTECLVLLLEKDFLPSEQNLELLKKYANQGYRVALQSGKHAELLKRAQYLFLDEQEMAHRDRKAIVRTYKRDYKQLKIIAAPVNTIDEFDSAIADNCDLFVGNFYTNLRPAQQKSVLMPIKANLIRLLNMVRSDSFEFHEVETVVRQDPALTVSLMRFINSPYIGVRFRVRSIRQAVTLLGQDEVRKWSTAAVMRSLGTDRPGEWTRLSLIRAKAAENLAPAFRMEDQAPSLFLTGLFTLLDVMVDMTMVQALGMISVSEQIRDALLRKPSPYLHVLEFLLAHEQADWKTVMEYMEKYNIGVEQVYKAYIDAMGWYSDLLASPIKPVRNWDDKY